MQNLTMQLKKHKLTLIAFILSSAIIFFIFYTYLSLDSQLYGTYKDSNFCTLDIFAKIWAPMMSAISVLFLICISLKENFMFNSQQVVRYKTPSALWRKHFIHSCSIALLWTVIIFIVIFLFGMIYNLPLYNWNSVDSWYILYNGQLAISGGFSQYFTAICIVFFNNLLLALYIQGSNWVFQTPIIGVFFSIICISMRYFELAKIFFEIDERVNFRTLPLFVILSVLITTYYIIGCYLSKQKEFYEKPIYIKWIKQIPLLVKSILADLKTFLYRYWFLTIPVLLISLVFTSVTVQNLCYSVSNPKLGLINTLLTMFEGTSKYVNNENIVLPISWLIIFWYFAFLCGLYIKDLTVPYQMQLMIRCGKMVYIIKNICVIIALTLIYFVLLALPPLLLSGGRFTGDPQLMHTMYGQVFSQNISILIGMIMPFITLCITGVFMLALSAFINVIYVFMATIVIYILSLFVCSSGLFGNWSNLNRSQYMIEDGLHINTNLFFFTIYFVGFIIIYMVVSKKKDWLSNRKLDD